MSENETNSVDPSNGSPGTILRRCREFHGITLDEVAEATKIGVNHLKALEDDQIGKEANLAYLKGFLRIYATYLGLNPDDMLRLYDRFLATAGAGENVRTGNGGGELSGRRRRFSWRKLLLPGVLLAMLIVTSAILNRSSEAPKSQPAPQAGMVAPPAAAIQPQHSSVRPASSEEKSEIEHEEEQEPRSAETAPESAASQKPPAEPAKGFIVRMKVIHNGTLAVTIDGAAAQNYDLSSGDIIEWKADKTIALELSNAGGVDAELNGIPLKPFGPANTPAYIVLDAHGVRQ